MGGATTRRRGHAPSSEPQLPEAWRVKSRQLPSRCASERRTSSPSAAIRDDSHRPLARCELRRVGRAGRRCQLRGRQAGDWRRPERRAQGESEGSGRSHASPVSESRHSGSSATGKRKSGSSSRHGRAPARTLPKQSWLARSPAPEVRRLSPAHVARIPSPLRRGRPAAPGPSASRLVVC